MSKYIILLISLTFSACLKKSFDGLISSINDHVNDNSPAKFHIANVEYKDQKLTLDGFNFKKAKAIFIKKNSNEEIIKKIEILSKNKIKLVASLENFKIIPDIIYDLIISTADAYTSDANLSSVFKINFPLENSSIEGYHIKNGAVTIEKLAFVGNQDGDILKWDLANNSWAITAPPNISEALSQKADKNHSHNYNNIYVNKSGDEIDGDIESNGNIIIKKSSDLVVEDGGFIKGDHVFTYSHNSSVDNNGIDSKNECDNYLVFNNSDATVTLPEGKLVLFWNIGAYTDSKSLNFKFKIDICDESEIYNFYLNKDQKRLNGVTSKIINYQKTCTISISFCSMNKKYAFKVKPDTSVFWTAIVYRK